MEHKESMNHGGMEIHSNLTASRETKLYQSNNKFSFIQNETYLSGIYSIENLKTDFYLIIPGDYI